jgi:hypothetical protein
MKRQATLRKQGGFLPQFAALAFSAVTTAVGIKKGRDAAKAQRRANDTQRAINRLQNKQNKRQFLRQYRQAQANALQAAVAANVGLESSAFQGMLQSRQAQAGTAVREFNEMDRLGGIQASAMDAQSKAQFQAGVAGAVGSFARSFIAFPAQGSTTPPKTPAPTTPAPEVPPNTGTIGQ